MIGASQYDLVLGSRPAGDKHDLKAYVRELARAGIHVVLVEPGTKMPLDMRSSVQRRADDNEAQQAAKMAGNPRWLQVRAPAGVHLATTDLTLLGRYMTQAEKRYGADQVNLGIEVGRSRILVVDADTDEAVASWRAASGAGAPTVSTPGKRDPKTGEWVHSNGGHWWYTIPEGVELPTGGTGAFTPTGGTWTAYWNDRQLLIPPSVRPEGAYRWNGGVAELPEWLYRVIVDQAEARKAKARDRIDSIGDSPIDVWASKVSWAELLEPRGWMNTGRVSNCGCAEWTAPGPHDNPKSATAHDLGCSHEAYDGASGHAPLHIWTDNPPAELAAYVSSSGTRTMSKMQFVAWSDHEGDIEAACSSYAVPHSSVTDPFGGNLAALSMFSADDYARRTELLEHRQRDAFEAEVPPDPFVSDGQGNGANLEPDDTEDTRTEVAKWFDEHAGPWSKFHDLPPVEYLVDGYLDTNSMSMIIGERNGGKSFVALDMAAAISLGQPWQGRNVVQGRVGYMVGEGLTGFAERIRAWEKAHGADLSSSLWLVDEPVQVTNRELWNGLAWWCLTNDISVLMLDTLSRITVGVDENAAKDMSRVVDALREVQTFAGCHVMVIHHVTRGTDHGRGSTATEGAADTVLLVEGQGKDADDRLSLLSLTCTKQKNHAYPPDLSLAITPEDDGPSAVLTSSEGRIIDSTDPFGVLPPVQIDELDRVHAVCDLLERMAPDLGLTRGQIVKHAPAKRVSTLPISANAREQLVFAAIDRAVREGYVEGVELASGARSTSRFVSTGKR